MPYPQPNLNRPQGDHPTDSMSQQDANNWWKEKQARQTEAFAKGSRYFDDPRNLPRSERWGGRSDR